MSQENKLPLRRMGKDGSSFKGEICGKAVFKIVLRWSRRSDFIFQTMHDNYFGLDEKLMMTYTIYAAKKVSKSYLNGI